VGYDAASLGSRLPTFRREMMPSSSRVLRLEEEDGIFFRNVGNRLHSDAVPYLLTIECSTLRP
jgi:hypothetical protein